jgi:hypothetical protein
MALRGRVLPAPAFFCFNSKEGLYMFSAIDAFVTWFLNQPLSLFLIAYICVRVFVCIWDALKSPGVFDDSQEESEGSTDD